MSGRHNNRRGGKGRKKRPQKPSPESRMKQSARDKIAALKLGLVQRVAKENDQTDKPGLLGRLFKKETTE